VPSNRSRSAAEHPESIHRSQLATTARPAGARFKANIVGRAVVRLSGGLGSFNKIDFNGRNLFFRLFQRSQEPVVIADWSKSLGLPTAADVTAVTQAVRQMLEEFPDANIGSALFLPQLGAVLPTATDEFEDRKRVASQFLVAGANQRVATFISPS
jgi:hypothetical protein